ncbi:DUF4384 domain-containing protein [Geomonas sp. Red32]|uniref:DUF4384 domain-containing protein n=1 Tax=Geomonas sp. Red32 TaxID=2912856 RepID=UPI00202CBCB5|nr:DUF4384 domain-containing protein [Geomonas sp. Red32]MCM0083520.1 DUF4384 domain-containing protein [Geomonas sp. Red32]
MKRLLLALICAALLLPAVARAAQSVIIETEGYSCMGDDKSRKQTESSAYQDGKRKATESAATYIESETKVKDAMLEKDLLSAYANALVKVLQEIMKEWYKDAGSGDCYRVKLKVEVVPDEKAMAALAKKGAEALESDPSAPLNVKIWTDRPKYSEKEPIRIFVKGNKPFYGRVVYSQADGGHVQLLPNPYRKLNYFNGGVVYELPGGEDRFNMETCAPFGKERITLYASTALLGDIEVTEADAVYEVRSKPASIPVATRGIKLVAGDRKKPVAAEFAESAAELTTSKKAEK